MKVIVAGSRTITRYEEVEYAIEAALETWRSNGTPVDVTEIVSGGARGADLLGEVWAQRHGIPVKRFEADWQKWGRAAGPIRNQAMACYADAAIIVWNGTSPGSRNMVDQARQQLSHNRVFSHEVPS